MKILFKKNFIQSFQGISKEQKYPKLREKLKIINFKYNLNSKDNNNNSIDSKSNNFKKEINNNTFAKSKIFGYSTEKTDYSSKFSDKNISKIKMNNDSKHTTIDNKVNKTIQFSSRNINIYPMKPLPNITLNNYHSLNTFSNYNRKRESFRDMNIYEMNKVITFTNNLFYSKTPQKKKDIKENKNNSESKKVRINKFNSLNCFIDDYMSKDNNEIKRYKTNFRDYFGDSDYDKLKEKEKTYLTEINKIKLIYKDTNLMKALCDYLNLSFGKLKNEKNENMKTIKQEKEEIKRKKKYLKFLQNNWKHNLIPLKDIFNTNNKKNNLKFSFDSRNKKYNLKNGYFSKIKI